MHPNPFRIKAKVFTSYPAASAFLCLTDLMSYYFSNDASPPLSHSLHFFLRQPCYVPQASKGCPSASKMLGYQVFAIMASNNGLPASPGTHHIKHPSQISS